MHSGKMQITPVSILFVFYSIFDSQTMLKNAPSMCGIGLQANIICECNYFSWNWILFLKFRQWMSSMLAGVQYNQY